jgi:hypothetical protein
VTAESLGRNVTGEASVADESIVAVSVKRPNPVQLKGSRPVEPCQAGSGVSDF